MKHWKKQFFIIWAGQGISILTSAVIQMAMVWYLTDKTGSAVILTMATLIGYLPQVLLGPFIGALIDRYKRKHIMIISDSFIAFMTIFVVIAGLLGDIPVPLIMFVMFARSIGSAFHNPSLQAVTPSFVPKEELTRYAGISQGIESASMLLSPGIAAMLFAVMSLEKIILFDVFGAAFAVLTLCVVRIPESDKSEERGEQSIWQESKEGFAVIRREKGLSGLLIVSALYAIIYFPIGTLFPLISMDYFRGGFVASGIVETVFSVGMLIGSLVLGVIGNQLHKMSAISFSIGLYGIGLVVTGLLPPSGLYIFVVISLFMGISIPFYRGVKLSAVQLIVEDRYLGRVLALMTSIQSLAMPIGLIVAGPLAENIGVEKWFLYSGIATLVIAAASVVIPSLRRCCD